MTADILPSRPIFEPTLEAKCQEDGNFRPILFEWYKYVAKLCHISASLMPDSPALRRIPNVHSGVLRGLLHRISRLMVSNLALTSTGKFGETTRIIDRCLTETALKVRWLCIDLDAVRFARFLADGLRNDLILKDHIIANIRARNGQVLVVEHRMLDSIARSVRRSTLTEQEIHEAGRLPDLWSLYNDLGLHEGAYIALQRMGSHPVHGTWTDLLAHYLDEESDGSYNLCDHKVESHESQFVVVSQVVLQTLHDYLLAVAESPKNVEEIIGVIDDTAKEMETIAERAQGNDYRPHIEAST